MWGLADDWQCSQTGPVNDIHFWVSMRGDDNTDPTVVPFNITGVGVNIYGNIPAEDNEYGYFSMPDYDYEGPNYWGAWFSGDQVHVRRAGSGEQGWFDPLTGDWIYPDHYNYYQVNITDIPEPFIQEEGEIYWLELGVQAEDPTGMEEVRLGWKTALLEGDPPEHFMDDAICWLEFFGENPEGFYHQRYPIELRDPFDYHSLDLAFVITPEPGTVVMLLGAGLMGLAVYARRRRKS